LLIQYRKGESFWGKAFNLQGCKESKSLSKWVGGVEEISSKFVSFSSVENSFLNFFESIKFQGESVWKRVLWVVENFNFQVWESVCCSFCVQNVFFSNGVLKSHGKVYINFHVFVSSFHNHNSLMGVRFFFDGEPVSYGLNQYLGVDGSVRIFTWCDYWTSCGDILYERTNQRSLINCSLLITLEIIF
jgi:hypothetical protein